MHVDPDPVLHIGDYKRFIGQGFMTGTREIHINIGLFYTGEQAYPVWDENIGLISALESPNIGLAISKAEHDCLIAQVKSFLDLEKADVPQWLAELWSCVTFLFAVVLLAFVPVF